MLLNLPKLWLLPTAEEEFFRYRVTRWQDDELVVAEDI